MSITTVSSAASTDAILASLLRHLDGNELALKPLCTRLMLRTGVNLRAPKPEQRTDSQVLSKIVAELAAMGIRV